MLHAGVVDIQVAIPSPASNYHPKMWLFEDERDRVLVRGSANATARALGAGVEHMDVDCSWVEDSRVNQSVLILNDWISGDDEELTAVIPLPQALRAELISCAPAEMPTVEQYLNACTQTQHVLRANIVRRGFSIPNNRIWEHGTFAHQGEAVKAWESNGGKGLIEMATGAGKTVTALICAQRLHVRINKPLLVVISAPTRPLVSQWKSACEEFRLRVAAAEATNSSELGIQFSNAITGLQSAPRPAATAFVVTNHRVSDRSFQRLIRERALSAGIDVLHIGDEAHSLGAAAFRESERDFANYRLGLSATPMRQHDELGTERLLQYFGEVVFRFGLDRAIGVCLVPYEYRVSIASIQDEELQEFLALSAQIGRKVAAAGRDLGTFDDESLTALLVRRRAVVENAADKFRVFRDIIGRSSDRSFGLVYTSSKNPAQLERALDVLGALGVFAAKVTETESANRDEFEAIVSAFKEGAIQVLVAKRVLDEGVDIPAVRHAVMLASSSVEREWVQRRGRILRIAPGKNQALIHDIIALPPPQQFRYERSVLEFVSSEVDRVRAFARHAINYDDAREVIQRVHETYFLR
jgi:superfamily II DNA or RNA helicase